VTARVARRVHRPHLQVAELPRIALPESDVNAGYAFGVRLRPHDGQAELLLQVGVAACSSDRLRCAMHGPPLALMNIIHGNSATIRASVADRQHNAASWGSRVTILRSQQTHTSAAAGRPN
jgi:hypothetical protein